MMAGDVPSAPIPGALSASTLAMLRAAVVGVWHGVANAEAELGRTLTIVAAEARTQGMRPEDLIRAFKTVLDPLPEPPSGVQRLDGTRFRERLVTLCIKAYYGV